LNAFENFVTQPPFSPAWWLPGPNLQTLWGKFMRPRLPLNLRLERIDTPDGDFLDLYHMSGNPDSPLLVLLHGLEGSLRSHYIHGLLQQASIRGWRAVVLIFRSCGNSLNRTRRFYHSGETNDLGFTIEHLLSSYSNAQLVLTGVSLGGNVLLKYLGERGDSVSPRIRAAAAVSVPYDLARAADHIDRGFAKIYQRSFIRSLQSKTMAKLNQFPDLVQREKIRSIRSMRDFDNTLTAPLHGFRDADDYYARSSALKWLHGVRAETLLLSAVDDPFLPSQVLDSVRSEAKQNPFLFLEFTPRGGHVGFVGGKNPFRPAYYMEERVGDFLAERVASSSSVVHNRGHF
jgi:predicted alpha/beta-fold hydrolase